MSEQTQTRLGMQNSDLSAAKVRRLTPDDLGIDPPEEAKDDEDDIDHQEVMREVVTDIGTKEDGDSTVGAAVYTADGELYTGTPVDGDGWGVHAIELAVSKVVSDENGDITSVAVFSDDGHQGLCGRCLQALIDTSNGDVSVEVLGSEGPENTYMLEELYPEPWTTKD